jgi:5-methylcytosine-specific restriction endonuclease McrBC regulatory subunit McrC
MASFVGGSLVLVAVSLHPVSHSLSEDYSPLHSLCRFFRENSGPMHNIGKHALFPFLTDTGRLFELFEAERLHAYLCRRYEFEYKRKRPVNRTYCWRSEI